MKYIFYINQEKAIEWDLSFSECCLIDLFINLPKWSDVEIIDGLVRYFFSKNKILEEAPILSKKGNIDTIYRQLKGLVDKGFLNYKKIGYKDFWQITGKIIEWEFKTNSEKNPSYVGKKSESYSEKNPTYNNINYNNNTSNNNNISKDILFEQNEKNEKSFLDLLKDLLLDFDFIEKLKNKFLVDNEDLKMSSENFLIYWTEKNPNGKKERWQMQKVFDIKKRFYTRIGNDKKFMKSKQKNYTDVNFESVDFNNI